ncbi:hypothetical protein ASG43_17680 [Aureimonas sp. Leaf454]|nr:hypothetical protein ASG43_17680 [Aureimonas sp. Leaf454]
MSGEDRAILTPFFELVQLKVGQHLFDTYEPIEHVYFFLSGLSSEIAVANEMNRVEVGCVGKEGLSGHPVLLGVERSPHYSFMQVAGEALRIRTPDLQKAMDDSSTLRKLLLRYVHVFMIQIASSAVSDARFTIEQRLARWLLMTQDRVGDRMPLTHEFLSLMLAVRRSRVTDAIHVLEGEHLIKAERGATTVLDRAGLLKKAAGSYGKPEREYEDLIKAA